MPKDTVGTIKKKRSGRAAQLAAQEAKAMGRAPKQESSIEAINRRSKNASASLDSDKKRARDSFRT